MTANPALDSELITLDITTVIKHYGVRGYLKYKCLQHPEYYYADYFMIRNELYKDLDLQSLQEYHEKYKLQYF